MATTNFMSQADDDGDRLYDYTDEEGYFGVREGKKPGVCNRCGKQTLHWEFEGHRWQLFNVDNTPHKCDEMKLAQEAFTKL